MIKNEPIEFLRKKSYIFQEEIGQGGTGKTILIKDLLIDEVFICKKYSPFYSEDTETYYRYFIEEIKLLHKVSHNNIVRVFNYYLYPEKLTGYILMEFIKGESIDHYIHSNPDKLNEIFVQVIEGFRHLEENRILHRDIRPENILVTVDGIVKIIDLGFGKVINFDSNDNSISLNWRYSKPNEFEECIYDIKTEIYFVGKLFEEILKLFNNINFKYLNPVSKMISTYNERQNSFFDIYRDVVNQLKTEIDFTLNEKKTYREFADSLISLITKIPVGTKYRKDIEQIIRSLEEVYKNSLLEEYIQNNNKLINIFLDGQYSYYPSKNFKVEKLNSMIILLNTSSDDRKKVILNNLWERFDKIERYNINYDDYLPF